jgi:hypothetical protein
MLEKIIPPVPEFKSGADAVNNPSHYGGMRNLDNIEFALGKEGVIDFALGNVLKYVVRHKKKGTPVLDLEKAQFYLNYALKKMKE